MKERKIKIEDWEKGISVEEFGETLKIELLYPRNNKIKFLKINISDVRASDGILVHYDFERDGYAIEQPYYIDEYKGSYISEIECWLETAFCKSWALEEKNSCKGKEFNEELKLFDGD